MRSRPQRSAVHRHTVDRHLVETVVLAGGLVRGVSRADLLLLAALLHDIGKVRGAHDHSVDRRAARRARSPPGWAIAGADVEVVATLVREHLTLIDLATRRDHQDPGTVTAARAAVGGSREVFDLLRGPHRGRRLRRRARGLDRLAGHPAAPARRGARRERLGGRHACPPPAEPATVDDGRPRVVARGGARGSSIRPQGGSYRIDVFDRDRLGLFADTAGLLAAYGLVVRTAILRTVDGVAANEWHVESPSGEPPRRAAHRARPGAARPRATGRPLGLLDAPAPVRGAARARRPASGRPARRARWSCRTPRSEATVIEVRAQDRPGAAPRAGHGVRQGRPVGALGAHRHVCRADARHLLRHRVRRAGLLSPAKVAQTVAWYRHLRRRPRRGPVTPRAA